MLDYRTSGESHGRAVIAYIEGLPSDLAFDEGVVNAELLRRQGGHGRGGRMEIEQDAVEIISGVRRGKTIGSPITLLIRNCDFRIDDAPAVQRPRPGHADLAGSLKWLTTDCRNVLERASARETAARVAAGATARGLLREFGIDVVGYVVRVGSVTGQVDAEVNLADLRHERDTNEVYCPDARVVQGMIEAIDQAAADGDTVGGVIEVQVEGHPPGLGSCMCRQDRLDGALMGAVGSIQAIKGVEIGLGFAAAGELGSRVHDEIEFDPTRRDAPKMGFSRRSNRAGGLEGGMTNGERIVLRAAMKPISTLTKGLDSVNLASGQPERSDYERSDVCAVPAASVVVENVVAFEIARAVLAKFGGDSLGEVRGAYDRYVEALKSM